ncbi:MAG: hypothetical protein LBN37_04830, partial [Bacteroidales bacterium]|nr:hypothetical protein [Bacteroidales bacterium]
MLTVFYACSPKSGVVSIDQQNRAKCYFQSGNDDFEIIFTSGTVENVQPKLTGTELSILDALVSKIDRDVCQEFDNKCLNWMSCWAHISANELMANPEFALQCNEA